MILNLYVVIPFSENLDNFLSLASSRHRLRGKHHSLGLGLGWGSTRSTSWLERRCICRLLDVVALGREMSQCSVGQEGIMGGGRPGDEFGRQE